MKKQKFAAILAFLVMITSLFSGCVAKLPIPDIKKGRFDFSVTYEINGEEKTYSGVYVCEFDGVLTTLVGSTREWKGYIENEKEREKIYKDAINSCNPQKLVGIIKNLYLRRLERTNSGKKNTVVDDRYFKLAENQLHNELSFALQVEKEQVVQIIAQSIVE